MVVSQKRWRWLVLVAIVVGSMITDGLSNTVGVYIIAWRDYFDCSMAEVSFIASVNFICYSLGGLSGTLVNRVGYRLVVVVGGSMAFLGTFLSSFASTKLMLCLTFGVISGLFAGSNYTGFNVALATYFTKNFSTIRGISCSGIAVGFIMFPPLLQYLIDTYGWQGSLLIYSALFANVAVCGMLLKPESDWSKKIIGNESKSVKTDGNDNETESFALFADNLESESVQERGIAIGDSTADYEAVPTDEREISNNVGQPSDGTVFSDGSCVVDAITFKMQSGSRSACNRKGCQSIGLSMLTVSFRISLLIVSQFTFGICNTAVQNHLLASMVHRGIAPQTATFLMSFFGGGGIFGRLANGPLVDFGFVSATNLYMMSMVTCGLGTILIRLSNAYWMYAALCVVLGACNGSISSLQVVLARQYVGKEHMGRALGMVMITHGTGGTLGSVLGGLLYDVTQSYDFLFYIFGGVLAVSGLIFLLEPKFRRIEAAKAKRLLNGSSDNDNRTDANENTPSVLSPQC